MKSLLTTLFLSLISTSAMATTVDYVDLTRYQGRWYEIASIPQRFTSQCVEGTTAEYKLEGDTVSVKNSCVTAEGERNIAFGRAKVANAETNAELKVTFVHLLGAWIYRFGGEYNVIQLEPNYQYAVVGHPTKQYSWILSRTPWMDTQTLAKIEQELKAQGYNTCRIFMTRQKFGFEGEKRQALCEFVKN